MTADEGHRKLAAILAADVAGYSRLMADDDRATVRVLTEYREVFSQRVAAQRGHIVDTAGDSVLATFDSVIEAVQAAVGIQRELAQRNEPLPDHRRMRFRIGVNLGDIIVRDDGTVYGDGVNVAARLEGLAEPGGVMVSDSAHMQVANKFDLALAYAGVHEVKNIADPVSVYKVILDGSHPVARSANRVQANQSRRPRLVTGFVAALTVLIGIALWGLSTRVESPDTVATDTDYRPVIAVLPFDNMSGDPEQDYFADGFTDTLITDLSRLWKLRVIARNSTFTYKDRAVDVRDVRKALGATHVVEGSILRSNKRIRINVQLIDTASGEHIWADRFDRSFEDVLDIQDEIVRAVIAELDVKLASGEQARVWRRSTDSPEAYDIFVKAREIQIRITRANAVHAQNLFQQALDIDPKFAAAMHYLAITHYNQAVAGWSKSPAKSLDIAERLFHRATDSDPYFGSAYGHLGLVYLAKLEHEKAMNYAAQGIEVSPGAANAFAYASVVYIYSGMAQRGLDLIEKATELDPVPLAWFDHPKGAARIFLGDYQGAISHYRKCLEALPDYIWCNTNIIVPYMELGMIDDARAQAKAVLRINPAFDTKTAVQVIRIKDPADREHWRKLLRRAGLP
jgi:adenylate cyclase